jgi:hypothetical protein
MSVFAVASVLFYKMEAKMDSLKIVKIFSLLPSSRHLYLWFFLILDFPERV